MDINKIKTKISKAKTNLLLEHPFFGTIAVNMPTIIDEAVKTACTNGKYIKFNPHFVDELTDEQVKFLVAHECMHPMLEHNFRRGGRQPKRWNKAGDYVINKLLVDEKVGKFIDGGCLSDDIYNAGKGTSEGIYNILPDEEGGGGGGGEDIGGTGEDLEDGEGTPSDQEAQSAEWRVKVAQAAQAAKMMGKLSANVERLVSEVLNPKVDWRSVMERFLSKARSSERSFSRPNRRFITQGLYLPTISGETLGEVAFAVDCSGSIGQKELDEYAAEVKAVQEMLCPKAIHVIYFDSDVCHYDHFNEGESVVIRPHGGGGTAFSPIFRFMADRDINPVATVVLTDLYCDDYGPAPEFPVLWVVNTEKKDAPWGEVIAM